MRTSDKILRQVRSALAAVLALSGLASLLIVLLALHAVPLLANDFAVARSGQLWLLMTSAAAATLGLLCIDAARERILQRAGLWLDHTLAHQTLLDGTRQSAAPSALRADAAAIGRLREALLARAALPALEAPWAFVFVAALFFLHPALAALAALALAVLLTAAWVEAAPVTRLDQQRLRAAGRVAMWWQGLPAAALSADAARRWERLNAPHVAAAYRLDCRLLVLRDLARVVRVVTLLAGIGLGVWLIARGDLSAGALVAAMLLLAGLLLPLERLLANLRAVRRAMLDYRRLAARPEHRTYPAYAADDAQAVPLPAFTAPVPRLHLGGPLALGFGAALLLLLAGSGVAAVLPQQVASLTGSGPSASQPVVVRHAKGGVAARLHVAAGAEVKAGDVLVSLDTTALDRQIAALRSDADAARKELDGVAREAAAVAALSPATIADKAKLASLEERIAELHQRADALVTRTNEAELDLARSVIRAPVAGHVVSLGVRAPNDTIEPGAAVAAIAAREPPGERAGLAEPILRAVNRMLRSLSWESAA
ncbi:MAG TPA: biotin/lipoyl-binding protein [Hyphomicrobiaceae bacterium]|nr:biotin/lipoyl-binding protein [Hyphomicrobiaceae bacterium]